MSESVIVVGGGGHAKVIIDCIRAEGDVVVGILDDGIAPGTIILDVPVLGGTDQWGEFQQYSFVIAVGNNAQRCSLAQKLDVRWHTAVHPTAVISPSARLGQGSVVMPRAVINAGAQVGKHCIINSGAIVEHDDLLEDFVHISPGTVLGGTVKVGAQSHIGMAAVVKNNLSICAGTTVGIGAVVVRDITQPGIYVGVPAGRMK